MALIKKISWILMAVFYTWAGINHFRNPEGFLKIMPPYLPAHLLLVHLSGVAESLLGISLCFPKLRAKAAWGIIALLIAVFPANIYMYQLGGAAFDLPDWALLVRLPLQGVLILWAYWLTKPYQRPASSIQT